MPVPRHALLAATVALVAILGSAPPASAAPSRTAAPPVQGPAAIRPTWPHGALPGFPRAAGPAATRGSRNWSGYVAADKPGSFTSVEAHWIQPVANCTGATADSVAALWVGLDGSRAGRGTVQQTGTTVSCVDGRPEYLAWYEMFPAEQVYYNDPVEPGDELWARVAIIGTNRYELLLRNVTKKWTELSYAEPPEGADPKRASAEVVVEAASRVAGEPRVLTDFGTVSFTTAKVNGQPLGDSDPDEVTMVRDGIVRATPSPLTDGGTAFELTWVAN
ncbi:G1 family glutamic endopeptidase [Kitasatospora sp. CM 4170]|uniref:G1 family glutamic endopeptidase n=1 Tax=Kitasatospora aburaviensis TaxID=67265 RepID=A0ABW1F7D9_9ACTN|nr:G1 family glutamic endopeptidase [Kitasatospora sp. CM 4170]WNM49156.1 G1 family glutamic endopeptidase [Kitasatospora sp. CM 4170]